MNKNVKVLLAVLVLAGLAVAGFYALNAPDTRTTGEKVGDAIDQLGEGVDDAARELEDRTPLERAADEVEDATDGSPE